MKKILLSISVVMALLVFTACEKQYDLRKMRPSTTDDSDKPAWAGGNTDLNDHSKGNDNTGIPKGQDYGDLYVLKRLESGVPEMGVTSLGVWYPKAVAFDVNGEAVLSNGEFLTLSVNEEGEVNDTRYSSHEVEFGRLNLIRAPEGVLSAGLDEAISNLQSGNFVTTDFCGRLVAVNGEFVDWIPGVTETDDKTIDSPRENMAIYRELMRHGFTNKLQFLMQSQNGFVEADLLNLSASALAAGSDKTGQLTLDEVVYVNGFLDSYGNNFINLGDVLFLNENTGNQEFCDDPYYSKLNFYNYSYSYDREELHGNKWIKVTTLDGNGNYKEEVLRIIDVVDFTNVRIDNAHNQNMNVVGFTQASDDAVQLLEFVHESSLVEYVGVHASKPTL